MLKEQGRDLAGEVRAEVIWHGRNLREGLLAAIDEIDDVLEVVAV